MVCSHGPLITAHFYWCNLLAGAPPVIFVLDNYDSFTYNLVQYLGELGADVEVRRNDQVTVDEVEADAAGTHRHFSRPLHAA